jgi:hypothetical protein
MRTRQAVLLALVALVVAASPASASAVEDDSCEDLLNALNVLENGSTANVRATDNLRSQAEEAGCFSDSLPGFQETCEAFDGVFYSSEGKWILLLHCQAPYSRGEEEEIRDEFLAACSREGGSQFTATFSAGVIEARCEVPVT